MVAVVLCNVPMKPFGEVCVGQSGELGEGVLVGVWSVFGVGGFLRL